jgi:hypothetical protein
VISAADNWQESENDDENDFDWASVATDPQLRTVLSYAFNRPPASNEDFDKRFTDQLVVKPKQKQVATLTSQSDERYEYN